MSMFQKKQSCSKKFAKGFTLVEIIVVLVILAVLAAATIPSLLGFIDDAKFKTIDNEARVVRNAAQAYATEQSAKGEMDTNIEGRINGVINSNHALHNLLQNDANGTVFETKVENGKIRKFKYTKEIIETNEDIITDKIRYAVFDDEKTSLLHANGSVATIDIEDFEERMIAKVTAALTSNEAGSLKSSLTTDLNSSLESSMASFETSLTTSINSNLESGMNSKIAALKTNFRTELGSNVVDLIYPVGSYYVSHSSTSPETLFTGTTWTQIESKFLYCMPASNAKKPENSSVALSVGGTGGSTTHTHTTGSHTLTVAEIPSHSHATAYVTNDAHGATGITSWREALLCISESDDAAHKNYSSLLTGGGQSHNHGSTGSTSNIPPYMAVYCWRRTA